MKLPLTSFHLWSSISLPVSLRVMGGLRFSFNPSGALSAYLYRIMRVYELLLHLRSAAHILYHSTAHTS